MSNSIGLDNLLDQDALPAPTHKELILVAVPFILLALISSVPQLLVVARWTTWGSPVLEIFSIVIGVSSVFILLGSLISAWRADWPRWSASWYLFFWALLISPMIFLFNYFEDTSRAADISSEAIAFFVLPVLIAWILYRVTSLDPVKGLLAVLPIPFLIWTLNMEFVPDQIEAPITIASMIIAALTAIGILKMGNWRTGMWVLILVVAVVGLLYSYAGIYHGGSLPFTAPYPTPIEVLKNFIPQFLAVSTLVMGPLLAVSFRGIGRFSGPVGRISYRFVLLGMLFILASVLANYFLATDSRVSDLRAAGQFWLNLAFIFGLLSFLTGVIILGVVFLPQQSLRGWIEFALLVILTVCLPVVLMMPLMSMFSTNFYALAAFGWIYSFPLPLIAFLGFLWFLLAGWLVSHHDPRNGSHNELQLI